MIWKIGNKITTRNLEVALPATVQFSPQGSNPEQQVKPSLSTSTKSLKKQNNEEKIISSSKNFFHDSLSDSFNPFIYGGFDDPFCVGQNCYALLRFKMMDFSLTGLTIDPKRSDSVTIDPKPSTKPQIVIERFIFSEKYIIWNSLGETKNSKN